MSDITPQQVLNELCSHCMKYVEDYDYEENDCGYYDETSNESIAEWRNPLQELVNRDTAKELTNGYCPHYWQKVKEVED